MNLLGSSLKKVFFANLFSQSTSALIGIIILPFYSRCFSPDEFGIFMIFYMSFTWVLIFDFGFTNYLNKFSTLYKNGKINKNTFYQVLNTYETFFAGLIILILGSFALFQIYNFQLLSLPVLLKENSFLMIFVLISVLLKLFTILYKASLDGFYLGNVASSLSVIFLAIRYIFPLIWLIFFHLTLYYFLFFQVMVSLTECICFFFVVRDKSGSNFGLKNLMFDKSHIFNRFTAFSLANSILYILITQSDKLLLIKLLPIAKYGEYASVIAVSNGIFYLSGPFISSISPRLIGLIAAGKNMLSSKVIDSSFELTSSLIIGASFWVGLNGILILKIIKPDIISSNALGLTFLFYAIGNGVYSLIGYLSIPQIALSNMKFNFILSLIVTIFTILSVFIIAPKYGIIGLAIFWTFKNIVTTVFSFFLYTRFVNSISMDKSAMILIKKLLINSFFVVPFYYFAINNSSSFINLFLLAFFSFISYFILNCYFSNQLLKYYSKVLTMVIR